MWSGGHTVKSARTLAYILLTAVTLNLTGCRGNLAENDKARFYSDALAHLPSAYPQIKIANVWSERWENSDGSWSDLRVNSSEAALQAYRSGTASSYYLGREHLVLPAAGPIMPPPAGAYLGIYPDWGEYEDEVSHDALTGMEDLIGKSCAYSPFSAYWGRGSAERSALDAIHAYGAVPELRLMPWGEPYAPGPQPVYALQLVSAGQFDGYLLQWADAAIAYGRPMFATFAVEMNGDWFPWSGLHNGGATTGGYGDPAKADGPERYIDAFRHVVDLFRGRGATNVTWVWQVNSDSLPAEAWNDATAYYPGDAYVDWVGMSVYGAQTDDDDWQTFDEVMAPVYNKLSAAYPSKPLMLAEWGCQER